MSPATLYSRRHRPRSQRWDPPKARGPKHSLPAPCRPRPGPGRTHRPNGRTHSALRGRLRPRRLPPPPAFDGTMREGELPHAPRTAAIA
eukprot:482557-Prymnesium_polylepis.1